MVAPAAIASRRIAVRTVFCRYQLAGIDRDDVCGVQIHFSHGLDPPNAAQQFARSSSDKCLSSAKLLDGVSAIFWRLRRSFQIAQEQLIAAAQSPVLARRVRMMHGFDGSISKVDPRPIMREKFVKNKLM